MAAGTAGGKVGATNALYGAVPFVETEAASPLPVCSFWPRAGTPPPQDLCGVLGAGAWGASGPPKITVESAHFVPPFLLTNWPLARNRPFGRMAQYGKTSYWDERYTK